MPPPVVTVTLTVPVDPAGAVTVIELAESAVMAAAVVPNLTLVAPFRWVPVMVTLLPPPTVPEFGLTFVTVGFPEIPLLPGTADHTNPLVSLPLAVKETSVFQLSVGLPVFAQRRPASQTPLV